MRTYQWNLGKNCFRSAWFWISIWVNVNSSDKHTGEISGKLNIQNLTCGKHCWFHFNCIRCQDSVIWFPTEWAWVLFHSFYFPISWVENWLTLIPALFPLFLVRSHCLWRCLVQLLRLAGWNTWGQRWSEDLLHPILSSRFHYCMYFFHTYSKVTWASEIKGKKWQKTKYQQPPPSPW